MIEPDGIEPEGDGQEDEDVAGEGGEAEPREDATSAQEWLLELRTSKVRYGRATLTIARWGAVALTDVGEAVESWRQDEATAEEVALAFVRSRVIEHSPSFDWETADLERLVRLVAEVAHEPTIEARTIEQLAPEIDQVEKDERKQLEKARQSAAKAMKAFNVSSDIWKKVGLAEQFKLPSLPDYSKAFGNLVPPLEIKGLLGPQVNLADITGASDISKLMESTGFAEMARASEQAMNLGNISNLIGSANLEAFNVVNQSLFADMRRLTASEAFSEAFGARTADFQQWIDSEDLAGVVSELIDAARDLDEPEVAEAAEDAADLSDEVTLEQLVEEIERLRETVDEKDSIRSQFAVAFTIWLLERIVVIWLVVFGIQVPGLVMDDPGDTEVNIQPTLEAPDKIDLDLDLDIDISVEDAAPDERSPRQDSDREADDRDDPADKGPPAP